MYSGNCPVLHIPRGRHENHAVPWCVCIAGNQTDSVAQFPQPACQRCHMQIVENEQYFLSDSPHTNTSGNSMIFFHGLDQGSICLLWSAKQTKCHLSPSTFTVLASQVSDESHLAPHPRLYDIDWYLSVPVVPSLWRFKTCCLSTLFLNIHTRHVSL